MKRPLYTSRIPTGRNDRNSVVSLGLGIQRTAQVGNTRMDIEAVHCMDAQCQNLLGILLHTAGRRTEDGYIHTFQFLDIFYHRIVIQFGRTVLGTCTTYDTGNFEIRRSLQSLKHIVPDIAITNDGSSYFFHTFIEFNYQFSVLRVQK